jgi:hypothetical protein
MNHHYKDIRDKLGEPLWWDEYAVPRYCEFAPDETGDIYAREAVLLEIACQDCGTRFKVCMTTPPYTQRPSLADLVRDDEVHYGDPPNAGCCAAGPTMNSVPLRVLEFWDRTVGLDWQRIPDLQREIECEWAT